MATSFRFRFRKFISGDDYAACGIPSATPSPAPFNNTYTEYNALSGNSMLSAKWNNAIVLSAPKTQEENMDYFKREWIEEDGVDVYITGRRKRKEAKNEIEMLIYTDDNKALKSFFEITDTLNSWGIFEYYDNYQKGLKRLVYEGYETIANIQRDGKRVIHFKLKCNNILGYDNVNFNASTGETIW